MFIAQNNDDMIDLYVQPFAFSFNNVFQDDSFVLDNVE